MACTATSERWSQFGGPRPMRAGILWPMGMLDSVATRVAAGATVRFRCTEVEGTGRPRLDSKLR